MQYKTKCYVDFMKILDASNVQL